MKTNKEYVPGELIRVLRQIKRVKQKGIYKGTSQQSISKLERYEKITLKKFMEVANAFNCNRNDIELARQLLPSPPKSE